MPRTGRPVRNQIVYDTFASNLTRIMTEQGISGKELATRLNTRPANVSRWRNAKVCPSGITQTEIARELKTSVEELNKPLTAEETL